KGSPNPFRVACACAGRSTGQAFRLSRSPSPSGPFRRPLAAAGVLRLRGVRQWRSQAPPGLPTPIFEYGFDFRSEAEASFRRSETSLETDLHPITERIAATAL